MRYIYFILLVIITAGCHKDDVSPAAPNLSGDYSGTLKSLYTPSVNSFEYGEVINQYSIACPITVSATGAISISGLPNYTPLSMSTYQNNTTVYAFYNSNGSYYVTGYFKGDSVYVDYSNNPRNGISDTLYRFSGVKQ